MRRVQSLDGSFIARPGLRKQSISLGRIISDHRYGASLLSLFRIHASEWPNKLSIL